MKKVVSGWLLAALLLLPVVPARAAGLDLAPYRGKVVYLDFWASWCSPCLQSFPWMKTMQESYGAEGLVILAVNVDRQREAADTFLSRTSPNFKVIYDAENKLFEHYQLIGMPTALLFDRQGVLRTRHVGWHADKRADYEAEIRSLLREKTRQAVASGASAASSANRGSSAIPWSAR